MAILALSIVCSVPEAQAATSNGPPRWTITSVAGPTNFAPSSGSKCEEGSTDCDVFVVTATNVGGESTSGTVTIADALPSGVEATAVNQTAATQTPNGEAYTKGSISCPSPPLTSTIECTYPGQVAPGDTLTITVTVAVTTATEGQQLENEAVVSGGGTASASTSEQIHVPTSISSEEAPFGVAAFFVAPSTGQAGAYPNLTTSFSPTRSEANKPTSDPRDIGVDLPPGLIGNPLAVPRCSISYVRRTLCPEDTAVGVATVTLGGQKPGISGEPYVALVYNITPYPGEPAAFAFQLVEGIATVRLDTSLSENANGEYLVHAAAQELSESAPLTFSSLTLWGSPANFNAPGPYESPESRIEGEEEEKVTFGGSSSHSGLVTPFLRSPTACAGPMQSILQTDSWQETAGAFKSATSLLPSSTEGFTGCDLLSPLFTPAIAVRPVSSPESPELAPGVFQAGTPSGYDIELSVPQGHNARTLAVPDLKEATVTLPAGVVVSPSAANGLLACSDAQFDKSSTAEAASCPQESQIGTVTVKTPLLEETLNGQVFVGEPECGLCGPGDAAAGNLLRLFLQIQEQSGQYVRVKLAGHTAIDQQTGQLTTTFANDPQVPFEVLSLKLKGGEDAPLASPSACGVATSTSRLVPWSSNATEPLAVEPSSSFQVGGCSTPGFSPAFSAAMVGSASGGAYSPFAVTFSRSDHDQYLGAITVRMPPGVLGAVSHVAQCPEAQANAGTCPQSSEIGEVTAGVGPGNQPYYVSGGRAYLTGPYAGAPFGLSIVVPAKAGPFTLAGTTGNGSVVVRASIAIDPHTAALTITSAAPPTELDGIPLQIKTVSIDVNRPQFTLNATNCQAMSVTASVGSSQGATADVSAPYQAHDCATLPFDPSFVVSTQGATSRADGASLNVKVNERPGDADIQKVEVSLPKLLPSRVSTLNHACTERQFTADPAGCPAGSRVGTATARTPLLNAPLNGPAYFVSHGGAAFPDLDIILQGEGVTIMLVGNTEIKGGITFSRFRTLPDTPVSSFELSLPEQSNSALAAPSGNLCGQDLVMPTTIVGQNGAQAKRSTRISITGCSKPSLAITAAKRNARSVFVTVDTSQRGVVTISGAKLRTTRKTVNAGRHRIKVPLTASPRASHKGSRTKLKAKITNSNGSASRAKKIRL
ncbi:MAG TPA: hypothetical protein VFW38_10495 [Solirubrobacteraceae bacterium]|nr:hypothetical protein [Solirubrobacteraceae bacterium]